MSTNRASAPSAEPASSPPPPPRRLHWGFLGTLPYGEAFALQNRLRDALQRGDGEEHLLLLEHPHVYTMGRNARATAAGGPGVTASPEWLRTRGIERFESDRGGQVTYHGPGQLVGYPIVDLNPDRRDIRRYVRDLLEVLAETLAELGVAAELGPGPDHIGLWVEGEKIASVGVHLSRWVTTHGFALNVSTDLSYFDGIVPCGLSGVRMTSVERLLGEAPAVAVVGELYARLFAQRFGRELVRLAEGFPG
jgi:lipoyl(octanoyl) transferase